MPPKLQSQTAPALSSTASTSSQRTAQSTMPPPPPPNGILLPEITALTTCLRNVTVKTGQIYGFYADSKRLGIQRHTPYPPRSLATSLGREVEKYDQLCDAIQSHLSRAILVLQRDLSVQEDLLKTVNAPPKPTTPPPADEVSSRQSSPEDTPLSQARIPPLSLRRQSTISLSSLHRPPFPHKLDLSSSALRLNPDEPLVIQSGLASPVPLAPKSSIPRGLTHSDMLVPHVDIDLTVPDDMPLSTSDSALGGSADKPIELDLDIDMNDMDLFGDAPPQHPGPSHNFATEVKTKIEEPTLDLDILNVIQPGPSNSKDAGDILKSLGASEQLGNPIGPSSSTSSLQAAPTIPGLDSAASGQPPNFDLDFSMLQNPTDMDLRMEDIFSMSQPPS